MMTSKLQANKILNHRSQVKKIQIRLWKKIGLSEIEGQFNFFTHTWNLKNEQKKHLKGKMNNFDAYEDTTAIVLAHVVEYYSNMGEEPTQIIQLAHQLSLNKGLKKFGKRGRNAAHKELNQIKARIVFKLINVNSSTPEELKTAMECLMFF